MCARLGLPFLDLYDAFRRQAVLDRVVFPADRHWNELGHASAAAAIDEHLRAHPALLGGR